MKNQLQTFVANVRLQDDGQIFFRGHPAQQSATSDADPTLRLTEMVYKYLYTHPSGQIADAFRATPSDDGLIAKISEANATKRTVQDGWIVRTPQADGAVIAERYGAVRKFVAGQYLADPDATPIRQGSPVTVTHLAGSKTLQPGFFHIFGQEQLDIAELAKVVRLYFNLASPQSAAPVAKLLSETLNEYGIPFTYKTAVRVCDYSRSDTAVLYLPKRVFEVSAMAISQKLDALKPLLDQSSPTFTKPIAHGIGLAEDPSDAVSFGASRSSLVAQAMLRAQNGDVICPTQFWNAFTDICALENLDIGRLYLNPGSTDTYDLPSFQPEIVK
ncbi:T3SS effector HopA1 family protein [Yoonia maritima]|uniref:T3SS effector HopA1 family protein n=1 Tax=Yoonia maritima TaxID=1435347 RepID=UPI000D1132F7|nr:T3SS effector HopA1 family protein [Yoonia maritima]